MYFLIFWVNHVFNARLQLFQFSVNHTFHYALLLHQVSEVVQ